MLSRIDKLGKVAMTVDKNFWSAEKCYDKLVLVQQEGGGTYISRKPVPRGKELTDRNYWIPIMPGETNYTNTNNSGNIVGRTAKCVDVPFDLVWGILSWCINGGDKSTTQSEISSMNKQIGFEIDCIKKSINLDEITPKIVTEADDNQLCFYEFISAFMSLQNNGDFDDNGGFDNGGKSIKKSNTKYAPTNEDSYMWKRNAVILKHDNDVLRCIEEHEELFYAYLYMIEQMGDSQLNQDLYYEQLGAEPVVANPYHDFSGTYVNKYAAQSLSGMPGGSGGSGRDIGGIETRSDRNINLTKSKVLSKEVGNEDKQESKRINIISREELNDFIENLKARSLERSTVTNKRSNTKSDYDYPDFPFETETEVNALTDFKALNCEGDQTINIKKYMISFYKMMKLFEAYPDDINAAVRDIVAYINGYGMIPQYLLLSLLLGAVGMEIDDDVLDALDLLYQNEDDIYRVAFHDKYYSILKEIQDAVNHFDVLLGNCQNMPYEDTISIFIKFKDTWYEIIMPQQADYFEPNREYKLVHTGDWKHIGTYNNQVITNLLGEVGHDGLMQPIDRTANIYSELYGGYDNGDNGGSNGGDNPIVKS